MRRLVATAAAVATVLGITGAAPADAKRRPASEQIRLLAINDFHGNLEPPSGSSGRIPTGPSTTVDAGGAAYLATHVARLSQGHRNALLVGAGDLVGASPLVSGLFHDEPAIEALSAMGMDLAGVGNHEFDEGVDELLRLQRGGCHPVDGCQDGDGFMGAAFRYLAANVRYAGTRRTILPPFWIRHAGRVPIVFIGLTLEGTPRIVTPSGVAGLEFDDEADTVNGLVRALRGRFGIRSFVVLVHEGGQQNPPYAAGFQDVDRCENPTGDIFGIVDRLDDEVDVVTSAHTHQAYLCERDGKTVTSAASFGRLVTSVDLTLSRRTRDVTAVAADNHIVTRDVPADPAVQAIVDKYKAAAAPIAGEVIGSTTAAITRAANAAGESALGDVIADAQLAATSDPAKGGAVVAFMNPGGIRADLPAGQVRYSDAYTVQPFANTLVVKTLTGEQIRRLLEQQFDNPSAGQNRILQVSRGLAYRYDLSRPAGSRVDPASITLDGATVDPNASYRVTMNSFLATGGDGFTVFNEGTDQLGGDVDLDALVAYFRARSPVAPGPQDRITRAP